MEKDFTGWHTLKTRLNARHRLPTFDERDIWWCGIGINIGQEVDGKGDYFRRPVLIVRKFSPRIFLGVPLTTKIKENPFYHRIHFKGQEQCVMLSQMRMLESKRLSSPMGQLSQKQFDGVRDALRKLI